MTGSCSISCGNAAVDSLGISFLKVEQADGHDVMEQTRLYDVTELRDAIRLGKRLFSF